jgi:hypothetical protein
VTKKRKYLTGTYHAKIKKANINTPHVSDYAETMDQFSPPLPLFQTWSMQTEMKQSSVLIFTPFLGRTFCFWCCFLHACSITLFLQLKLRSKKQLTQQSNKNIHVTVNKQTACTLFFNLFLCRCRPLFFFVGLPYKMS